MTTPNPDIEQIVVKDYKQIVKDSQEKEKNDKKEQQEKYIQAFDSYYRKLIISVICNTEYMHRKLTKIAKSGQTEWKKFIFIEFCNGKGFLGRLRGSWRWHFETYEELERVCRNLLPGWSKLLQDTISKDIYFVISGVYYGVGLAININIEE